jgi:Ca2+-binding RTX toxin-like protein
MTLHARWRVGLTALAVVLALVVPARAETDQRILGGSEAATGDYPFAAALVRHDTENAWHGQFCGGSVIADRWILTAAHCVAGKAATKVDVVVGRTDLIGNGGDRIRASSILIHPRFDPDTMRADLALIELARPTSVEPVRLPADGSLEVAGGSADVVGWGDTGGTPRYPSKLRSATVSIVSDEDCKGAYGGEVGSAVMLCAGDRREEGVGSCFGDSGGPLVVLTDAGWAQVGVVSWAYVCGSPEYPIVHTRVSALVTWIAQVTGLPGGFGASPGTGEGAAAVEQGGAGGAAQAIGGDHPIPPVDPIDGATSGTDRAEYTCAGFRATIVGTTGDDVISGTEGIDVIVGRGGHDRIEGLGGDDIVCGGVGDDHIDGGPGQDRVFGNEGDDVLLGGDGDDLVKGSAGDDTLDGGAGWDKLVGGGNDDTHYGGAGDDVIRGGTGDDVLHGGGRNDRLLGGPGADVVSGDGGNDRLAGSAGSDQLFGGPGFDVANGGDGVDTCDGETATLCEL